MKKINIVFTALLIFFLLTFILAQFRVMDLRSNVKNGLHVSAVSMPPELLIAFAGEFKGIVANYLLLEAANFIGGNTRVNETQWDAVALLINQSSILDPYFKQTYILAQGVLPWQANRIQEAMVILDRSKQHRNWDWRPGFFIGFNYFYFFKDYLNASQELMQASKINDAPVALATWASKLASKSGQTNAAIEFLKAVHDNSQDEQARKVLQDRISALKGILELEKAIDRFRIEFHREPETLEELVSSSIISAIPHNPYGSPFTLNDGQVDF